MLSARELLERFRPVGAPGAAAPAGVPADRVAELSRELQPVFDELVEVQRQCAELRTAAVAEATARRGAGAARARAIVAAARLEAEAQRADAAARERHEAERSRQRRSRTPSERPRRSTVGWRNGWTATSRSVVSAVLHGIAAEPVEGRVR